MLRFVWRLLQNFLKSPRTHPELLPELVGAVKRSPREPSGDPPVGKTRSRELLSNLFQAFAGHLETGSLVVAETTKGPQRHWWRDEKRASCNFGSKFRSRVAMYAGQTRTSLRILPARAACRRTASRHSRGLARMPPATSMVGVGYP